MSWKVCSDNGRAHRRDRLREEYFTLLPDIRRVATQLEAEVRFGVLPVVLRLKRYERVVTSRIKERESALNALRRRQEGATFDEDGPERYSLTNLPDLAGVRVLVFPRGRLTEVDLELRERFPGWAADPVLAEDPSEGAVALKYFGYCDPASRHVRGEYQVVPMLIGLFWDVEHSAIYKPAPELKGIVSSERMRQRTDGVLHALRAFEATFESLIDQDPLRPRGVGARVESACPLGLAFLKALRGTTLLECADCASGPVARCFFPQDTAAQNT